MRFTANSLFVLAVTAGMFMSLQAMADVPQEFKVLERFVGTWRIDQTMEFTASGRKVTATGFGTSKWVLGGRFLEYVAVTNPGEQEVYMLLTYDETKKKHRSWYFNSYGLQNIASGTWDENTKTLTRTGNLRQGNIGKAVTRFLDDNTIGFSFVETNRDEKVLKKINSTLTRQRDAVPVVRKKSKGRSASPPELKTLERLIGKWSDEGVMKVAAWTPEEVRFNSESDKSWVLGGKCVFQESKDAIFLTTYSANDKAVKMWHFNAAGYIHEWSGQWDDSMNVLTLNSDLDGNPTVSSVLKQTFNGNDTNSWTAIATDKDGKVYHHIQGVSKRRK
jgi:hypothetical protein